MIYIENLPHSHGENNKSKEFNLGSLTVWVQDHYFYLEPNYQKSLIPTVLQISRQTEKITEIKAEDFKVPADATPYYFSFLIGIININNKKIIFLVEEAQLICTIKHRDIFKVTKPIFMFYNPEHKRDLSEEEAKLLVNFVLIFEQGMYFSFFYNLSEPLHSIRKREKKDADSVFNWAQNLQKELLDFDKMWTLPLIQGFVNKIEVHINAEKIKLYLISRRSMKRGGPLQYTTGLDHVGHVANYVETEFIISINDLLFSFIQVRGSAPVFWKQNYSYGMASSITISKTVEENQQFLHKHLQRILDERKYESLVLLNLLNSTNSSEAKLIQNYEYMVKQLQGRKNLFYCFFDMKRQCENKSYKSFNNFLKENSLRRIWNGCGFTTLQMKEDGTYTILDSQKGVIRTNCGTCIDRTNIAQSRIAAYQMVQILKRIDVKIEDFDENLQFLDNDEPFAKLYRNLWADNADSLSKQYTGTESTQSFALRQGKLSYLTSFDHGLTSLSRAIRNIREEDQEKNKAIFFITGQK